MDFDVQHELKSANFHLIIETSNKNTNTAKECQFQISKRVKWKHFFFIKWVKNASLFVTQSKVKFMKCTHVGGAKKKRTNESGAEKFLYIYQ